MVDYICLDTSQDQGAIVQGAIDLSPILHSIIQTNIDDTQSTSQQLSTSSSEPVDTPFVSPNNSANCTDTVIMGTSQDKVTHL